MNIHQTRMLALINFTREASPTEPYGCSIYDDSGSLLVSVTGDKNSPINHAEILAINQCARLFPQIKWDTLTLYTTGEPCCMCASACCWANLKAVIYATDIPFMIELWGIESPLRALEIMKAHPKVPALIGDICATESNQLFIERKDVFAKACEENRWL